MKNERFMVANITWNPYGWRRPYTNPKAGHRYARKYPGHESLNFDFNKKGLDNKTTVFGFIQWTQKPIKFSSNGIIFFYSKNLDTNVGEIVGVYGNANVLAEEKRTTHRGFQDNELISNISGEKPYSFLFPIPLESKKYAKGKKYGAQGGYTYIDELTAERIISDEISEVIRAGYRVAELEKMKNVYKLITGRDYAGKTILTTDQEEQEKLSKTIIRQSREQIIRELKALTPKSPETVIVRGRQYRRDNKTIAQLKRLRGYKCQICNIGIPTKNKTLYVEAAHIKAKRHKGPEIPSNILILCPNHHAEFDKGEKKIIIHTEDRIIFELNGNRYEIDLSLQ